MQPDPPIACDSSPELSVLTVSCASRSVRFLLRSEFVIPVDVVFFIAESPVEQCGYGNFGIPGTRRRTAGLMLQTRAVGAAAVGPRCSDLGSQLDTAAIDCRESSGSAGA